MEGAEAYETEEKKKFQITRGMVILAAIVLVVIIIIIIVVVSVIKGKEPEYTTADFTYLESRMEDEAVIYVSQKNVELTSEELSIDLKDLLEENGGTINSEKVKAAKVCEGYVLAYKQDTEKYDAYIKCGDMYTTNGYESNKKSNKKTTTISKDTEKPVITIKGEKEITINQGSNYVDEGATAMDNVDGDITSKIKTENLVNVDEPGSYKVTYKVTDKAGNQAEETRKVNVVSVATTTTTTQKTVTTTKKKATTKKRVTTTITQKVTTPPTITLKGSAYVTLDAGDRWSDPGYSAKDAKGTDITASVTVSGNINTNVAGTYTLRYSVTDSYGNSSSKTRTIRVKSTYVALQGITLTPNTVSLSVGQSKTLSIYFNPTNATNKSVTWSSSNPSVATISNGTITAKSKGTATITASGADDRKAYVSVTVK